VRSVVVSEMPIRELAAAVKRWCEPIDRMNASPEGFSLTDPTIGRHCTVVLEDDDCRPTIRPAEETDPIAGSRNAFESSLKRCIARGTGRGARWRFRSTPATRTMRANRQNREVTAAPEEAVPESGTRVRNRSARDHTLRGHSLEQLYRVVTSSVRRKLGAGFPDRDDLIQEVLERVVRSVDNGSFSGRCSLTTWATAIANRVVADHLRAALRERLVVVADDHMDGDDAELPWGFAVVSRMEARSALRHVQRMFRRIDVVTGECVLLHDLLECELREVAARMGMSTAAVQSRVLRGRKKLLPRVARALRDE
jgi:RNA polymerase sigma factor (sigma-70 family)